ncbi:MAG: PhzF family phenazine biosynthesis protein [Gammaproteobacteria bacterium]
MAAGPRQRRFKQVDVFTSVPFKGNPLAVVLDAEGLSDQDMQAIARWTNLSETTFVLAPTAPEADYRVRIFSPGGEFPFAGHPTLGTAHALLEHGLTPRKPGRLVQECGVGLVPLEFKPGAALAFQAPPATLQPLPDHALALLADALQSTAFAPGHAPLIARMGIGWLIVRMQSAEAVLAARPRFSAMTQLLGQDITGVAIYGPHAGADPVDYEVRAFFDKDNALAEDPVTGSANACIAWVLKQGGAAVGYAARQGTALGCDGRILVRYRDGAPWIGGHAVTVIDGTLTA